ncbi:apolipoprotein D-like [Macrobrachium rosenbergii]|uniref:apolipoprotein D-like n=1 Tax=Macrobrachium rosenbergii TaxID=79674 RepID=UPI0034D67037
MTSVVDIYCQIKKIDCRFNYILLHWQPDFIEGIAKPGPDPTVGDLIVSFPAPLALNTQTPNYRVVTTDYVTHSVVYSCASFAGKRIEFAWILGREPYIPRTKLDELKTKLESYGIDTTRFTQMRQLNCPRRPLKRRRNFNF